MKKTRHSCFWFPTINNTCTEEMKVNESYLDKHVLRDTQYYSHLMYGES